MKYPKVNILSLRKVNNLADFYLLYANQLEREFDAKKQYSMLAKLKTSLIRYVLPGWEFPLKLDGNLSALETLEGLKFMEKIPIHQAVFALDVQDTVFDRFGDRVSAASQRVYRCELKKMIVWGRSQSWWKQSVETGLNGRTPTMTIHKKRSEHWHTLKPKELPSELSQELDDLAVYMRTLRRSPLAESSWIRYRREILGAFGWLYRVKGVALSELSLSNLVPVAAIHDVRAAEQVGELVQEYLEWLQIHIGDKNATLLFALNSFSYIAEYVNYEFAKSL